MYRINLSKTVMFLILSITFIACGTNTEKKSNSTIDTIFVQDNFGEDETKNRVVDEVQNYTDTNSAKVEAAQVDLNILKNKFKLKSVKAFNHDFVRQNIGENFQNADPELIKNLFKENCPDFNDCKFVSWQERDPNFLEFTLSFSDNFGSFINYYIFNNDQELLSSFAVYYEFGSDFNIQNQYGTFTTDNTYKIYYINETYDNMSTEVTIDSVIKLINIDNKGKISEQHTEKYRYTRK